METIYCIECRTILPREKAQTVFMTGFYKVKHRLAICIDCCVACAEVAGMEEQQTGLGTGTNVLLR